MKERFRKGFKAALYSGIIGALILCVLLYVIDKEINWLVTLPWFVVFVVILSFFYGWYLERQKF